MDRCVLDTSVIIKSIFTPLKSLLDEIYKRELETHKKCRSIIGKIEEDNIEIFLPKISIVETLKVFLIHMKLLMKFYYSILLG